MDRFRDKKGYITNVPGASAEFTIGAYHRLYEIERSFRMSKHDLAARPIYHDKRALRSEPGTAGSDPRR
jgi:hypothetical protein